MNQRIPDKARNAVIASYTAQQCDTGRQNKDASQIHSRNSPVNNAANGQYNTDQ